MTMTLVTHVEFHQKGKMRESYRSCLSKTRRKLALSEELEKYAADVGSHDVSIVSDDLISIVESVAKGDFDCAAAVSRDEDQFLEAVKAAATAKKVMLLDLGSALGMKAREHFYGSPDVLSLGMNPARKIRPKDGTKAGDFDAELSWMAEASECGFMAALFCIILPVGYNFDPNVVIVVVDENSPQVSGQLVHHLQACPYRFALGCVNSPLGLLTQYT